MIARRSGAGGCKPSSGGSRPGDAWFKRQGVSRSRFWNSRERSGDEDVWIWREGALPILLHKDQKRRGGWSVGNVDDVTPVAGAMPCLG